MERAELAHAGGFAGRRWCRLLLVLVVFVSMMCLGSQRVSYFLQTFLRFSHCQDRALERDRPNRGKKTREQTGERLLHFKLILLIMHKSFFLQLCWSGQLSLCRLWFFVFGLVCVCVSSNSSPSFVHLLKMKNFDLHAIAC